jgi:hypothetical protein
MACRGRFIVDEPNLHWLEGVASVYAQAEANLRTSVSFRQHTPSVDSGEILSGDAVYGDRRIHKIFFTIAQQM